jgi:probable phosphoglycerate mutase
MSDTVLTLVRHGETEWNAAGRIQGHLDIPLSTTGLAHAAAIGRRLGGEAFDTILSSVLERALQTAHPIVRHPGQVILRDARLREERRRSSSSRKCFTLRAQRKHSAKRFVSTDTNLQVTWEPKSRKGFTSIPP